MPLKKYKPTSPGRRLRSVSTFEEITTNEPERSLVVAMDRKAGRNSQGRITSRHRGGGTKPLYRRIDFKRNKLGVQGRVATIEYDPNRSCRIALVNYRDGEKRYILAPHGLKVGDVVEAGDDADVRPGNAMTLSRIPLGSTIHNIEINLGRGGQLVRSAGGSAQLLAREGELAQVRLPSGEVRRVAVTCTATIGQLGNLEHENERHGKAGASRHRGIRPQTRGVVMNPRDHPHGGGEARSGPGGNPQTPWGKPAMGYRTRRNKSTDKMIVRDRRKA